MSKKRREWDSLIVLDYFVKYFHKYHILVADNPLVFHPFHVIKHCKIEI